MKSKLVDCFKCPLFEQKMVFGETNVPDDLNKVKLLVLAEAPAHDETIENRPLIGKAGKVFRKEFEGSGLSEIPHFITNVVLCSNLQKDEQTGNLKTYNPPIEAIELCRTHWKKLISILNPEYIMILGSIPMKIFEIPGTISKMRGKTYDYKSNDPFFIIPKVFLTFHPSYISRGTAKEEDIKSFKNDFRVLYQLITGKQVVMEKLTEVKRDRLVLKEPYYYELPNWMKTDDICLVDIQRIPTQGQIVFIMKTKDGKRKNHIIQDPKYYFYKRDEKIGNAPVISNVSEVELFIQDHNQVSFPEGTALYEADIKPELKYAIDYYLQRKKEETFVPLKIMYFDIEAYGGGDRRFPDPRYAKNPINAISYKIDNNPVHVLLTLPKKTNEENKIDEKILKEKNIIYKTFINEKELLMEFCKIVKIENPEILTGWNCINFDAPYIYTRMKTLGINPNTISPLGYTMINVNKYGEVLIAGLYVLDMLELFKRFTPSVESTYKLGAIAKKYLGEGKVEFEGLLDEVYDKDITKFIMYSGQDTNLLYELSIKLGHIDLRNELRRICCSTWKSSESTTGLIDPFCISYAKKRNLVCKNADIHSVDEKLEGAYVRDPIPGLHSWLIDLDFSSLYPSIIISCNIGPDTYIGKIDKEIAFKYIYKREQLDSNINVIMDPMYDCCFEKKMSKEEFLLWIAENNAIVTSAGTIFLGQNKQLSFFNLILDVLLKSRNIYKNKMKDSKRANNDSDFKLNKNIQHAFKILANSIYGVLGNNAFRMFKMDLARSVTLTGQEVAKFAGHHLSKYMKRGTLDIDPDFLIGYDEKKPYLIYQDTDSVFLQVGDYLTEKGVL